MTDSFKNFWAWVGAATAGGFGLLTIGLILKDQTGSVAVLGAGSSFVTNTVGALAKVG